MLELNTSTIWFFKEISLCEVAIEDILNKFHGKKWGYQHALARSPLWRALQPASTSLIYPSLHRNKNLGTLTKKEESQHMYIF